MKNKIRYNHFLVVILMTIFCLVHSHYVYTTSDKRPIALGVHAINFSCYMTQNTFMIGEKYIGLEILYRKIIVKNIARLLVLRDLNLEFHL